MHQRMWWGVEVLERLISISKMDFQAELFVFSKNCHPENSSLSFISQVPEARASRT
jgi:hypothetical protein